MTLTSTALQNLSVVVLILAVGVLVAEVAVSGWRR